MRHRNLLLQASSTIATAGAVDLNHAFVAILRDFRATNGGGAPGNFHDVAGVCPHTLKVEWRQARNSAADVLYTRLGNAEFEACRHRGWSGFRHETSHVICQFSQF
jgi:hypothetical protein